MSVDYRYGGDDSLFGLTIEREREPSEDQLREEREHRERLEREAAWENEASIKRFYQHAAENFRNLPKEVRADIERDHWQHMLDEQRKRSTSQR